jgi:hypothetical protein
MVYTWSSILHCHLWNFATLKKKGNFIFLPHFTWLVYDLPLITLTSLICHALLL